MVKITNLLSKILFLSFTLTLFSCHFHHDHHHDHIDERYPFLGSYHAEETFYNPQTNTHESFQYDIEIRESNGSDLEIAVTGYGNNGIYGTNCTLIGSVYGAGHIDIPLNLCHYNSNVTYEIIGHGDLSSDGEYLTFDLDIVRCNGGICHDEPEVSIEAHRI
ncbi:hypothetical protein [Aureispira anguillae]|uniref:Lipoprotein n=1 Tax=Aureispira anguillae TaxID=2864201 RepID=A0A915YJW4_9BACT|nr:hypothetical protein [Aureispira anguillae]BDS14359.1 hypothetical protein AsAng_0051380 [Aureispira anguillae]